MITQRLRILCVDDDPDVADSEAMFLEMVGYEVRVCYDGPSALRVCLQFSPHVCLIDLNMPGMDGCEVAQAIRPPEQGPPPLLIARTAQNAAADFQRTKAAGFEGHLVKPVDPQYLLNRMAALSSSRL